MEHSLGLFDHRTKLAEEGLRETAAASLREMRVVDRPEPFDHWRDERHAKMLGQGLGAMD